jgi:hypothetical protein
MTQMPLRSSLTRIVPVGEELVATQELLAAPRTTPQTTPPQILLLLNPTIPSALQQKS